MTSIIKKYITRAALAVAAVATPVATLTGCNGAIYEDLDPCEVGARLRFVFDYNMEYANSFPNNVDCLTLFIYDSNGNFVGSRTETSDVLADESWRMTIDLPAGKYHLIAYGGMSCPEASFTFNNVPDAHHYSAMGLSLNSSAFSDPSAGKRLHDLYYGSLDLEVTNVENRYTEATLPMMRDTNSVRVLLQQLNGEPLSKEDFTWEIVDDNTVYAHDNSVVPAGDVTYRPWITGTARAGIDEAGREAVLAFGELSVPRLMKSGNPQLIIRNADDGKTIVNIPLINYLLLSKSHAISSKATQNRTMTDQEYLDRENNWQMVFFLDPKMQWIRTTVVINNWTIRINEADV